MSNRWVFHNGSLPPGSALLPEWNIKLFRDGERCISHCGLFSAILFCCYCCLFRISLSFSLFFLLLKMNKLEKLVVFPLGIEMDVPSAQLLLLMTTDLWGEATFHTRNGNWDISIEKISISQRSSSLWQAVSVKSGQWGHKSGHLTACDTFKKRKQTTSSRNANIFSTWHLWQIDIIPLSIGKDRKAGKETDMLDVIWESMQ